MKESINKYLRWLLIALVVVLFSFVLFALIPYSINYLILQPKEFEIVGDGTHWLSFWATYISAIASFTMVFITWRTLQQNREQINELKRQWEEQNRPYIAAEIIRKEFNSGVYTHYEFHLCITNIGNSPAYNLQTTIDKDYIKKINVILKDITPQEEDSFLSSYKEKCLERIDKINDKIINLSKGQRIDFEFMSFVDYKIIPIDRSPGSFIVSQRLSHLLWKTPISIAFIYNNEMYKQTEVILCKANSSNIVDVLTNVDAKLEKISFIYENEIKRKYDTK